MSVRSILFAFTVVLTSLYYGLFHTALPIKMVTGVIGMAGIEFKEVGGSLESGVHIDTISSSGGEFILRNFRFDFNGLIDLMMKKELKISKLSIDELTYIQAGPSPSTKTNKVTKKTPKKDKSKSKSDVLKDAEEMLKLLTINDLHISKVHIKLNTFETPLIIDNFKVLEFNSKNTYFFKSLDFSSNMGSLFLEPDQKGRGFRLAAVAKPSVFAVIKKDLSLNGNLSIEAGKLKTFQLEGFDGRFKANLINNDLIINLLDLDFAQYLNKEYAITWLNGDIVWGNFQHPSFENIQTKNLSLKVGLTPFTFKDEKLLDEDKMSPDKTEFLFSASNTPDLLLNFAFMKEYSSSTDSGKKFLKVSLVSNPSAEKMGLISRVYYQSELEQLSVDQKASLEKIARFFE